MQARATLPSTSPERIFETLVAYQRTAALQAAIELDIFTSIGATPRTAVYLSKQCKCTERGVRMLCDYLVVTGFLSKKEFEYSLAEDSATFLDRNSPMCLATVAAFIARPDLTDFRDLADIVRSGRPKMGGENMDDPTWVDFARSMAGFHGPAVDAISRVVGSSATRPLKILDIAAGHGAFGIAVAKNNLKAQLFAVDSASVLEVAQENAVAAGVAERYHCLPGDAFTIDFGSGYDVVLLTGFLHLFNPPKIQSLLRRVYCALAPNGRVITCEFVPNEDRVTPPQAAAWVINMLARTQSGDAYTFSDLEKMFLATGFLSTEVVPVSVGPQKVLLSLKREDSQAAHT